jgi:hypothetical protein
MPIADAPVRGLSSHGGGTRARNSATSSPLSRRTKSGTRAPDSRAPTRIDNLS